MFQTNPETLQYFSDFSELDSPEKQKNSETFKAHGEKVSPISAGKLDVKFNKR